jgi:phosphoenolpyruvate carboxykinase (GTP)
VPKPDALNLEGLSVPRGVVEKLLAVDREDWINELPRIREFFSAFGDRLPLEMSGSLAALARRLRAPAPA